MFNALLREYEEVEMQSAAGGMLAVAHRWGQLAARAKFRGGPATAQLLWTIFLRKLVLLLCAVALVSWSASTLAASPDQAPPLAAGMARIWFVQPLIPGSTFYAPTILVNGANVAISPEGTAFYRDYVPGLYKFTMANCGPNTQTWLTLTLQPSTEIALLVASNGEVAWDCQIYRLSQVQPNMVSTVFAPLRYLGQN